jgi:SAM-dependent methyltransferase
LAQRANIRRICGLDISAAYIEHAARKNHDSRIEFQVGDACAIPFPERSFDRVLSMLMLHFVPQAARAVAEMRRIARPGSTIAATVWDARGGFVMSRLFWDTAAMLNPKADELRARNYTRPMCRPGELAAAWRAAGLSDIRDTMLTIRMDFTSFDDFWAPMLGREGPFADYVASLNADRKATLRDNVRRAYFDGEPDGPRSYAAIAWAVKGTVPV